MQHPRRFNGRARAFIGVAIWAVVSIACAVSVPPSGGPEDKNPPTVSASVPAPDSTGVDPRSDIRIQFSEPMRRERVERMVAVNPAIEFDRVSWEGNTLVIHPAKELQRDTTYVVRIKPDYQDRHNVPAAQWHEFAFATGTAPLDTARIEGAVTLKRAPAPRAIVRCWQINAHDTLNIERDRPDREATATRDGQFKLRYLPSKGQRFVVMAFMDENTNRVFDPDTDPGIVYADTVVMQPGVPVVAGVNMALVDPKEPGKVTGTVTNESGVDSARVMVAMYDVADSTRAAYRALCDSTGAYQFNAVKSGSFIMRAFVDIKADSLPGPYPCPAKPNGCTEPSVRRPGLLRVTPGLEIQELPLVIRREEEP